MKWKPDIVKVNCTNFQLFRRVNEAARQRKRRAKLKESITVVS